MPEIIAVLLLVLWFVCLATSHALGGLVHLLAVVAAGIVVARLVRRRPQLRCSSVRNDARRRHL